MTQVLVVSGSSRPGGVAETFAPVVVKAVEAREGIEAVAVDVRNLELPFFNEAMPPSSEGFAPTNENAIAWTKMVADADAVVLVTPEYNKSMTAIQKNAIDWIYKEWIDKPVALVGYGWGAAVMAHENARTVLNNVKANIQPTTTNLGFMKDLNVDGTVADESAVSIQLTATLDELLANV